MCFPAKAPAGLENSFSSARAIHARNEKQNEKDQDEGQQKAHGLGHVFSADALFEGTWKSKHPLLTSCSSAGFIPVFPFCYFYL
jgi:hypothetical protein